MFLRRTPYRYVNPTVVVKRVIATSPLERITRVKPLLIRTSLTFVWHLFAKAHHVEMIGMLVRYTTDPIAVTTPTLMVVFRTPS